MDDWFKEIPKSETTEMLENNIQVIHKLIDYAQIDTYTFILWGPFLLVSIAEFLDSLVFHNGIKANFTIGNGKGHSSGASGTSSLFS